MDIYIDHDRLETEATSFEQIISAAQDALGDSGRIIVEVRLDGDAITEEQLNDIDQMMAEVMELQLITSEPAALALAALSECQEVMSQIREQQSKAGDLIQDDQHAQAMTIIQDILQHWLNVQQTVLKTSQLLGLKLEDLAVKEISVIKGIDQLADRLKGIKGMLMNQDWVALSDTLSYEMEEDVDYWEGLIDLLIAHLEK